MKEIAVLLEYSTESFAEELHNKMKYFLGKDDVLLKMNFANGKSNAKLFFFENAKYIDVVISEFNPDELVLGDYLKRGYCKTSRFEQLTCDIETLQLAYMIKDTMPFCSFIVAADFSKFRQNELFLLAMKAKKIGVETFLLLPLDTQRFNNLLKYLSQKLFYEQDSFSIIGESISKPPVLVEKC